MPGNPKVRRRHLPYQLGRYSDLLRSQGGVTTQHVNADLGSKPGIQITESVGHPWPPRRGETGDVGGPFTSTKSYIASRPNRVNIYRYSLPFGPSFPNIFFESKYNGPIYPLDPTTVAFPPSLRSSDDELNKLGATAVSRCKPTNAVADVSTFLGELMKDGLPHLIGSQTWKARAQTARSAGSEYLNVQFGWRPLVDDISDLGRAITHANTVLEQYERDAGRVVRRRYEFPSNTQRSETTLATGVRAFGPNNTQLNSPTGGTLVRIREIERRQWFSGAFTYHLPTGSDSRKGMARFALEADKLFGLSLTPDVLWNLAPWSWAVDWFANVGDVLSNVSDTVVDGLVMRYGYIMEHTRVSDTYAISPSGLYDVKAVTPLTLVTETKIRRRANPFGFGISWDGLSPYQLSIAAALGLSRSSG